MPCVACSHLTSHAHDQTGDKEDGAWKTAISTLVKKGFVQRHPLRSTPHYSLTTEGEELAERLSRTTSGREDSAPASRLVSVATAKAPASAGQLHGVASKDAVDAGREHIKS